MEEFQHIHIPIMVEEILQFAAPSMETRSPNGMRPVIVDGTAGEGGHISAFLGRFPEAIVFGFDRDPQMIDRASRRLSGEKIPVIITDPEEIDTGVIQPGAAHLICAPFSRISEIMTDRVLNMIRGEIRFILLDLGVSMHHFRTAHRGFSYTDDSLDMRLSPDLTADAADILQSYTEQELADVIYKYGEERHSRRIAKAIKSSLPVTSAKDLAGIITGAMGSGYRNTKKDKNATHPAARTFQALRIEVNQELKELETALKTVPRLPVKGGRMAVISFHSLEDRLVKESFRELGEKKKEKRKKYSDADSEFHSSEKDFWIITAKPVIPTEGEVAKNPASRSSKLRVLEKKTEIEVI